MRNWIVAAVLAIGGIAGGWFLRGRPVETVKLVTLPAPTASAPTLAPEPLFPEYPKPPLDPPVAKVKEGLPASPPSLVGEIPNLPATGPGLSNGPVMPDLPSKTIVADINADEALARRVVLESGAEIVSSADAKDSMGKVGRAITAETDSKSRQSLQVALRKALGDRAILSDAGTVNASTPAIRQAEEALETLRKQRDQARIDFLPQAPTLRQIEDDYLERERALADLRKASARVRLTILVRPVLGAP